LPLLTVEFVLVEVEGKVVVVVALVHAGTSSIAQMIDRTKALVGITLLEL
jgi:hypothetical protein